MRRNFESQSHGKVSAFHVHIVRGRIVPRAAMSLPPKDPFASVDLVDTRLEIALCPPIRSNRDLSQRHSKIEMNDMMKRGPRLPLDCLLLCPGTQTSRQGISEGLCGIIMQYLRRRAYLERPRSLSLVLRDLPVAYFPSESFFYMRRTFMDIMERARATHERSFRS